MQSAIAGEIFYLLRDSSWQSGKDVFGPNRVQIIGISADTVEKQKAFVEREKLTVLMNTMISDPSLTVWLALTVPCFE